MLSRHLSIALRTLRKRWGYTLIHILGLAAGLAACFLIGRYVVHEWSYDRFHADADDIHRVTQTRRFGTVQELAVTPPLLGPAMEASFPSVEGVVRLVRQSMTVAEGGDAFRNQAVVTADSSFLEVFSFPVQRGAPPAEALAAPYAAVLTASAAERYFGAADPVGQPIEVQGRGVPGTYTVRAVVADVPETSHLQFDVVASVATIQEEQPQFFSWGSNMFYTYVQLADGTDPASLEAQFDALVEQNLGEEQMGTIAFALQPLTDIHLYSDLIFDLGGAGSGTLIMVLAAIAVLVLVIAGINFVNLLDRAGHGAGAGGGRAQGHGRRPRIARGAVPDRVAVDCWRGLGFRCSMRLPARPSREQFLRSRRCGAASWALLRSLGSRRGVIRPSCCRGSGRSPCYSPKAPRERGARGSGGG
jgi:putative ABC transport system permease protein